ncbi:protein SCARECROW 2-like [Hordeum vulgare]|nr:protein SCARECROW 2-like [Hordeum vulgare]
MSARIFSSCLGLYAPLLHALRHGGMPTIRPNWLSASMESLQITRKRLSNLALDQSFEFEFCQVANKVGNLDPDKHARDVLDKACIGVVDSWSRFPT